eukprot:355137-Chlamydomonas_euryale.AAC.4
MTSLNKRKCIGPWPGAPPRRRPHPAAKVHAAEWCGAQHGRCANLCNDCVDVPQHRFLRDMHQRVCVEWYVSLVSGQGLPPPKGFMPDRCGRQAPS